MNFNITPLEIIELPNKSILRKISEGCKINWVFIPGGPGLGEDYLEDAVKDVALSGNVYLYKFPRYRTSFSDVETLDRIESDLRTICETLDNLVLVGHSFGGMLLQVLNLSSANYRRLVLLCSSPNLDCFSLASSTYEQFSSEEKIAINRAQNDYEKNKNDSNFKNLFKSWAPYYVEKNYLQKYLNMIEGCAFDHSLYDWGDRFFYNYFEKIGKIPLNTTLVGAIHDKICPISLFTTPTIIKPQSTEIVILNSSSHFPWVENSELFNKTMQKLEIELLSKN